MSKLIGWFWYADIYGIFRNKLCHEYFIEIGPNGQSGVFHYYSDSETKKLESQGIDVTKGIAISKD